MPLESKFGAFVVSLDFELHWGVRDKTPANGSYRQNLLGVRAAIPRMLDLFDEFGVGATWATVGFLFARNRQEIESRSPSLRPHYADERLDPYREPLGDDENSDPLHFGAGLVDAIAARTSHEIGTHTFSHYYCLADGQTKDQFRADLQAAITIAQERGISLRSLVFPRNQRNPAYDDVLRDCGIVAYRGNQAGWMHAAREDSSSKLMRAARLMDSYIPLSRPTARWRDVRQPSGLCDVPATMFLRPWSRRLQQLDRARRERIRWSIVRAARERELFHLWWHPHNFGKNLEQNIAFLRSILEIFADCRSKYGMRSMTMAEVADAAA